MMGGAAFFDVDGTLVAGNIVRYYADLRSLDAPGWRRAAIFAGVALQVPRFLILDRQSRGRMQRAVYGMYRGFDAGDLARRARAYFDRHLRHRLYPEAMARIALHQGRGEPVVLVTGSLRPIVTPLAAYVAATDVLCSDLETRDGICTGRMSEPPLAQKRKAAAVAEYIATHGLDRAACSAYADSLDDIPMLSEVGHAHAVNPGSALARVADRRGWTIERWSKGSGE